MQIEILNINSQGNGYGVLNDKKVFIPKTSIGDIVEFEKERENKDYIIGKINKIIKPSKDRTNEIPCPFYEKCGGCNLLHLNDFNYYDFKINIIQNAIKKAGFELNDLEFIKIKNNSRRRVILQVKNNQIGFFEKNTNELVKIDKCFLIKEEINEAIKNLEFLIKRISNIYEISITSYENGLELLLTLKKDISMSENKILKEFIESNKNIIIVNYKINNGESFLFYQKEVPTLTFNGEKIKIELPSNVFLQATDEGQEAITKIMLNELKNCKNVLDLYCGIGTYSFPLSSYTKVHSVEGNQLMIDILKKNIKNNKLNEKITLECKNLVSSPLLENEINKYDGIVINPPRNGAKAQIQHISKSNVKKVIIISCNPETFSSDAKELKNNGYKLKKIVGIDQFYRTQHLEIVGVFEK